MPLLTMMRRTPKLSDEQRALREAWEALTEKVSLLKALVPSKPSTTGKVGTAYKGAVHPKDNNPYFNSCSYISPARLLLYDKSDLSDVLGLFPFYQTALY